MVYCQQHDLMKAPSLIRDKCNLRPVSREDIERSLVWRNDEFIKKTLLTYRLPVTRPMEEEWIEKAMNGDKDRIVFAIDGKEPVKHVGFVELNSIDYLNRNAQFAIVIGDESARGKGIASDATRAILQYGFNTLNLHKMYLQVVAYNEQALHLYDKIGFKIEGVLRQQLFLDGEYHNMVCMGVLKEDFKDK